MRQSAVLLPVILILLAVGGCASSRGPSYLTVSAASYGEAFDAACRATHDYGMPTVLRDRRAGIIETSPEDAGSVLEPWKPDAASFEQGVENTLAHQRRRARFEFRPAGFQPPDPRQPEGPDLLGMDRPDPDLTTYQGDIELRVWVYVERAHVAGLRRGAWSRSLTTRTTIMETDSAGAAPVSWYWTPVGRDQAFERRLMAAIADAIPAAAD